MAEKAKVSFSHKFRFATYSMPNGKRIDFHNGMLTTSDAKEIKYLREHDDMGQELAELDSEE